MPGVRDTILMPGILNPVLSYAGRSEFNMAL